MKYFVTVLIVFCLGIGLLPAQQNQYPVRWAESRYMDPGNDVTRGLAYNKVTDHVLIATRKYGNDVIILDAATGDSLGKMDTGILSGGTYPINLVAIADDGTIYVCNLSAPQFTPGSTFKVYRYANETASPELVFDDALADGRYGDALAAVASGSQKYIYSSGQTNDQMVVLRDEGGSTLVFDSYITLPQPGNARHGISPVAPGGNIWINGADSGYPPPRLISNTGDQIATVPDSIFSAGGSASILHMILGEYKLLTVTNGYAISIKSAKYYEDQIGTVTFDYYGMSSDSLPLIYNGSVNNTNINATSVLAYDSRRHAILSLFGYNSIASSTLDTLLKASTPRRDTLEISMDGINDFFPTDHVGASNERDMYLTWSEGKVFVGVRGQTLIDPTLTKYMFVAFDLDPAGGNGTATPPLDYGGVTQLSFNADVVIMVEPYNQADYLLGSIFKWNGSSWDETFFDGNLASQGALAYGDEGSRKIVEMAAVRNAAGIGTGFDDISIMMYVAENSVSGNVLCSFPEGNPIGNGATFTQYYYTAELGSGYFPTDTTYVKIRGQVTSIEHEPIEIVREFELLQNYPNPFNPQTEIKFSVAGTAEVAIEVYDITGRLVEKILDKRLQSGSYSVTWKPAVLSSGVYFYRMLADREIVGTRKMILMK
ncbi:MAG: T9SS C-terminal target domain-containing protein [Calditrichaeota bacterium]|nr:T9SS type A sorting domain-containing protein [Calditrichota bacterium]RQW07275.1 MAG: T9SS C-terminal target domain-containing protein [Calditrichota bacterium]